MREMLQIRKASVNDYIYITKENENITLSLENMFYNKKINYTYDEYLEHLKLTKNFEKENIKICVYFFSSSCLDFDCWIFRVSQYF